MKSKLKKELENELTEIVGILITAQESFKIVDLLLKSDEDEDISYEKKANAFFSHCMRINWRVTVIELSKLFNDRETERFNLHRFIKKLQTHFVFSGISEVDIKNWQGSLKEEKQAIDNLLKQRDKVYAHTDSNHKEIPNTVSIKKMNELIEFIQQLIRKIYSVVFQTAYLIETPINSPVKSLEYIFKLISEAKKMRRESMYFGKMDID